MMERRPGLTVEVAFLSGKRVDLHLHIDVPVVKPITATEEATFQLEHDRTKTDLRIASQVSSAVLHAAEGAALAAATVSELARAQVAREVTNEIEAAEARVAEARAAAELRATHAADLAAEAERASETWERAARFAARGAASRLVDSPERRQMGAKVLMTTVDVARLTAADAKALAVAALAADEEAARQAVATPWSNGFTLVCEMGWVESLGWKPSYSVQRFGREREGRDVAAQLWCCWVLYKEQGTCDYEEVGAGGLGLAHDAIRRYVKQHMEEPKREARRASRREM